MDNSSRTKWPKKGNKDRRRGGPNKEDERAFKDGVGGQNYSSEDGEPSKKNPARQGGPYSKRGGKAPQSYNAFGRKDREKPKTKNKNQSPVEGFVSEEAVISPNEKLELLQAEQRLKQESIYSLKKKSLYTCTLCNIILESVPHAEKHIKDRRHRKRAREMLKQEILTEMQPPSAEQINGVCAALEAVVLEHGINDQDVETRQSVVSVMQDFLISVLPEIRLRLYGSSRTKFGFKDSDVNIDIQYPPHMNLPDVLLLVKKSLSVSGLFVDVEGDFHATVPVVVCKDKQSGLVCKVSAGNENAFQTSCYLSEMVRTEPLLLPLVLGFRRWAKICDIDHAEEGGLAPYIFALLVIYFLQKRRVSLLPTYLNQEIKVFSLSRLSDFSLTHVKDGFIHWAYTPSTNGSSQMTEGSSHKGKVPLAFQSLHPPVDVGLLWIEMLRFYSLEFNIADNVISVRTGVVLSRSMKDWPKRRIAVEDPFSVKRNVARTLKNQQMYDYVMHCLKTTYMYFGSPLHAHNVEMGKGPTQRANAGEDVSGLSDFYLLNLKPEFDLLSLKPEFTSQPEALENGPEDSDCIIEEEVEEFSDSNDDVDKGELDQGRNCVSEEEDEVLIEEVFSDVGRSHLDSFTTEDEEVLIGDQVSGEELLSDDEGPDVDTPGSLDEDETHPTNTSNKNENKSGKRSRYVYKFSRQAFTAGKTHMVVCSLCKCDGHQKKDCPDDLKKVQLDPLPSMTPKFLQMINKVCEQCFADFALVEHEADVREYILKDLETFIRNHFPEAKLQLFGSSKNGFGFRQSDLDICMVLEGKETVDDVDVIVRLERMLRKYSELKNITAITTAKVPIVKFCHVHTGLEGDISLYNTLALHNTRLLASYAAIDRRVKVLCYVMKVFAKMCDIGEASRGSLSSYAYTLMVLFFLQQRNPPVIPVLQEIYDGEKKPEVLVDGWNVYFFDDLKNLPSRWPMCGKNTETVGELWLGLLRFYTEEFDFREHIVCVRQRARITTFRKQWTTKPICIEDPFDLNHNLGVGLSRKMANFIMKAFINGRKVFGTPVKSFPPGYPNHMEYFLDPQLLTEGESAPNDRCCPICGRIGHFFRECPLRRKSRQKRDSEKRFERFRDVMDSPEGGNQGQFRHRNEHWRKKDAVDTRCCFLCGSNTHIKKNCTARIENFASSPPARFKHLTEKEKQALPFQEPKTKTRKQKQQNVTLGPQEGSLSHRSLGQRWNPME
ncbi:terminal uridylyltransferase 7 isoform X2 [Gouania willdenowi]|uniref:terminal uridylyltransferase 7 isoform X2 n=1 Tax=Gouania willdenowi TaxID=441366 RepID=UPI00105627F3|nr:terminal uridylyltransferase 7-like isoform X2 [Gouania willdenowi]